MYTAVIQIFYLVSSVKPLTKLHSSASTVLFYDIKAHTGFSALETPLSTFALLEPLGLQIALF
jgi:hypothetical protein